VASVLIFVLAFPFAMASLLLAAYGLQTALFAFVVRNRRLPRAIAETPPVWPRLTVQLPVYDEPAVVSRLIDAACALDYPGDRLEVQVLDDSPDGVARARAVARVAHWRGKGVEVRHIARTTRIGFKAGALAHGLSDASGELICIFDADFVPPRDFLRQTVPALLADRRVGLVQARWTHLNEEESLLTRAQAAVLDVHFVVEQGARQRAGLPLAFNGTAGVWRRECIEEAGGWSDDTLTEDLDLSYRAWLAGWRLRYLPDVTAPGELPPTATALRRQQARWAKGTAETARLLMRRIVRSNLGLAARISAVMHMGAWIVHPCIVVVALLLAPLRLLTPASHATDVLWGIAGATGGLALVGVSLAHLAAAGSVGASRWARLALVPAAMAASAGLAVRCTRDVVQAMMGLRTSFQRTPKGGAAWAAEPESWRPEATFGLVTAGAAVALALNGYLVTAAFESLFAAGAIWLTTHGSRVSGARRFIALRRPAVA
jgi:cellulose synthase/poly-beta-1,6-N-acetylglucosamine synthase-like glycosyltransferase